MAMVPYDGPVGPGCGSRDSQRRIAVVVPSGRG